MTPEQQRKMMEAAAKACGITLEREISGKKPHRLIEHESGEGRISVHWNPLTNPADTAEMCAKLEINTFWWKTSVECYREIKAAGVSESHDGTDASKEAAQRLAATMVAAKIGGYEE